MSGYGGGPYRGYREAGYGGYPYVGGYNSGLLRRPDWPANGRGLLGVYGGGVYKPGQGPYARYRFGGEYHGFLGGPMRGGGAGSSGRGGFGGGRGRRDSRPLPTKEELDNDLDKWRSEKKAEVSEELETLEAEQEQGEGEGEEEEELVREEPGELSEDEGKDAATALDESEELGAYAAGERRESERADSSDVERD